jgi:CHASE2 domain
LSLITPFHLSPGTRHISLRSVRQSILVMLVVLLFGIIFVREPRLQQSEEIFLRFLLGSSQTQKGPIPLTIVDLGNKRGTTGPKGLAEPGETFLSSAGSANSPLELALFLQALQEFQPTVVAFERVLNWPADKHDEEQVFLDQAMRIPKLLLAAHLTATPDPDAPAPEIAGFPQVMGNRGELPAFSGIAALPDEDLRLISALGFVHWHGEIEASIHAPLLYQYRGEVIPSFALQAAMLWMKVSPSEVKIDLGSSITFPNGFTIPIQPDGTALVNPSAAKNAHWLSINAILLGAEQHDKKVPVGAPLDDIRNQIVLARPTNNPFARADVIAAAIASVQTHSFIRRVNRVYDCMVLLLIAAVSGLLRKISRIDLLLVAIAFTAAYCLLAFGLLSRSNIWLPGFLPLGAIWFVVVSAFVVPKSRRARRPGP